MIQTMKRRYLNILYTSLCTGHEISSHFFLTLSHFSVSLGRRKWRLQETKQFAQTDAARMHQSWKVDPGLCDPDTAYSSLPCTLALPYSLPMMVGRLSWLPWVPEFWGGDSRWIYEGSLHWCGASAFRQCVETNDGTTAVLTGAGTALGIRRQSPTPALPEAHPTMPKLCLA